MRILTVSDEEVPALWEHYLPGRLDHYDLILSAGDLKSSYLSFLVTMAKCPVLYVPGNHDGHYADRPPEGCDNIDCQLVTYRGLRILGLGGCRRYRPGPHQYTENEMRMKIWLLQWKLRRLGGVDVVVTHAPPEGLGDDQDPAHWGFAAFRELIDTYHPAYLVHGHVHMTYNHDQPRILTYGSTKIINAYERYELELPDKPYDPKNRYDILWHTRPKGLPLQELARYGKRY